VKEKEKRNLFDRDNEPDVNLTRDLLIWSQTRYHCATDPVLQMEKLSFIYTFSYDLVAAAPSGV
jgi:hypothetical protein